MKNNSYIEKVSLGEAKGRERGITEILVTLNIETKKAEFDLKCAKRLVYLIEKFEEK